VVGSANSRDKLLDRQFDLAVAFLISMLLAT
jgi:hypothetical protein